MKNRIEPTPLVSAGSNFLLHRGHAINTKSEIGEQPFIDYPDRWQFLDNWLSRHFSKHSVNQDQMQFKYFVNNLEAVI